MKTSPHNFNLKDRLAALLHLSSEKKVHSKFIYVLLVLTILSVLYLSFAPTRRYAVFAGYSTDGKIAPYTLTYLQGLKEVTDGIVYITDSPLLPEEQKKLKPYVIHSEHYHHGEYDWGSYKRGFNWLKHQGYLRKANELILANDSTYAPLKSFKPMFKTMALRPELDFWGNSQNIKFNPHLQSYFLVFRRPLLRSKSFASFLNKVKTQPHFSLYITEYEIKLTPYLASMGYKWDSYLPNFSAKRAEPDSNCYPLTAVREYDSQFIKRRLFNNTLALHENKSELLNWLQKQAPQTYKHILSDFPTDNSAPVN